jgi:hypothetical protein
MQIWRGRGAASRVAALQAGIRIAAQSKTISNGIIGRKPRRRPAGIVFTVWYTTQSIGVSIRIRE